MNETPLQVVLRILVDEGVVGLLTEDAMEQIAERIVQRLPYEAPTVMRLRVEDLEFALADLNAALAEARGVEVMIQPDGFKWKFRGRWSPGVGRDDSCEPEPVATAPVPADCRCGHEWGEHWLWDNPRGPEEGCYGSDLFTCDCPGYVAAETAGAEG